MYGVFDNGKAASEKGFPYWNKGLGWENHLYPSFEEAKEYARNWLGKGLGDIVDNLVLDVPQDYDGYGDTIEIKFVEDDRCQPYNHGADTCNRGIKGCRLKHPRI